jgi:hypothetical protein
MRRDTRWARDAPYRRGGSDPLRGRTTRANAALFLCWQSENRKGQFLVVVHISLKHPTKMMVTTFNLELCARHFPSPTLLRFKCPEEDSNLRQHDGVGAEISLQRLSAKCGEIHLESRVSANLLVPKTADEWALSGRLRRTPKRGWTEWWWRQSLANPSPGEFPC